MIIADVVRMSMPEMLNGLENMEIQAETSSARPSQLTAAGGNIIELNNCNSIEARIEEAAGMIRDEMLLQNGHLIQDRPYRNNVWQIVILDEVQVDCFRFTRNAW